jgi:hypothetical protein
MNMANADPQVEAQFGLEKWMKGDAAASAAHLSAAARALGASGALTAENCDARLVQYLRKPTVNIFACMNSVIDAAVKNWSQTQGAAVKAGMQKQG